MTRPSPFPAELRTAAIVPRWSVVHTIMRDTIASHSYFVTLYSFQIANLIEWDGDYGALSYRALSHDLDETVTGDIVSPVKREIVDDVRAADYIDAKMWQRMPGVMERIARVEDYNRLYEIDFIVTAADRLDALLFLVMEKRMGNGVVAPRIPSAMDRFEQSWRQLPASRDVLDELWHTVMRPAVISHETVGGFGV